MARAVREYQEATNAIDAAGSSADAMAKASERFERATATMETVGGWDAETFALQVGGALVSSCHETEGRSPLLVGMLLLVYLCMLTSEMYMYCAVP